MLNNLDFGTIGEEYIRKIRWIVVPKMPSFQTLLMYWYVSRGIVRGVFQSGPSESVVVD